MKIPGRTIVLLLALSFSCISSPKDSYKKINQDLFFKLHSIGEKDKKPEINNYLTVHFVYKTITDSAFFESVSKFKYSEQVPQITIGPVFEFMSTGDSASLMVNTKKFFRETLKAEVPDFLQTQEMIKIDLKIQDIQTEEEFEAEKNLFISWVKEFNSSEEDLIMRFLNNENLDVIPDPSGLYYIPLTKGTGKKVVRGRRIRINYQGRFLNGYFVDDTYKRDAPLDFVFGTEFYIIEGMEKALEKMREGDRALIILPSDLAFGSFGSAGGIVPPFTTLIYELEVLKVY